MYRHAVVITPVARWVLIAHGPAYSSLAPHPQRRRPSPSLCKVGAHIGRFEACSTFTAHYGLSACCIAKATHLSRRLRRFRHLHHRSDSSWLERPSCQAGLTPAEDQHLHTAHTRSDTAKPPLSRFRWFVTGIWRKWLSRRRRQGTISWVTFYRLLERYPLPPPVAIHSVYRPVPSP